MLEAPPKPIKRLYDQQIPRPYARKEITNWLSICGQFQIDRVHSRLMSTVARQPCAAGYFGMAKLEMDDDAVAAIYHHEQGKSLAPQDAVRRVEPGKAREAGGEIEQALQAKVRSWVPAFRSRRQRGGCDAGFRLLLATLDGRC